ncbi:50S ribosomal protein L37Ae [Candidatus Thorarchaeota archaeon]|nr:MAG: 50S ribosomal protein L37Ae [Candidatus Thorarchaeota archaeon]
MGRTKKVGSTGRFGPRYGAKLRRRVLDLELRRREPNRCPACATRALKREAVGLWACRKCGLVFAGGAYVPFTDAGKAARRAIAQRVSDDLLALREEEGEEGLPEFLPNIEAEPVIASEPEVIEAEDLIHDIEESSEDEEE